MTPQTQSWRREGDYLVGLKDGSRVHLKRVNAASFLKPGEIAPGVGWCENYAMPDESSGNCLGWADGVYEHQLARFRQMGKSLKRDRINAPPRVSRRRRYRARLSIRLRRIGYKLGRTRPRIEWTHWSWHKGSA